VNPKPAALFPNHALAVVNGVYYDPSYGRTYSSEQDMENQVIDGYFRGTTTTLPNGVKINCFFFKEKENLNPRISFRPPVNYQGGGITE